MSTDPGEVIKNAHQVLNQLLQAGMLGTSPGLAKELLQPRDEDYAKAFLEPVADGVRRVYAPLWVTGQLDPRPKRGQAELRLWGATTADLQAWNNNARAFPGGYQEIAQHLAPNRLWFRWKFVEPGETLGMAFDGLVWMDDHWAWFPKPWRAIREAVGAGGGSPLIRGSLA